MHWFLVGQSYTHPWDRFDAQYKVLDGIYKLSGISAQSHARRPVELANRYGVILPQWAIPDSTGKKSVLSTLRNELVHEAKYGGHPIGYSHPPANYDVEFVSFNTKLICGALGINTPYLQMNPSTLSQFAWDITI
jgi:hypothetical protein